MADSIVLCVDDDTTVLNALRSLLSKHLGPGHVVEIAASGDEAIELHEELRVSGQEIGVIISDYIMPGMRGDELLVQLHQASPNTVTIMLTGQSDLEGVKRAINGANLYRFLEKPFNNADIVLTTRSAVLAYQQARELQRKQAAAHDAERLAVSDRLTGAYHRQQMETFLQHACEQAERDDTSVAVLLVAVDGLKAVNHRFGLAAGDALLVQLVSTLRQGARDCDLIGRWSGVQCMLIVPQSRIDGARLFAAALAKLVQQQPTALAQPTTVCIGISAWRGAGDQAGALLVRAEVALEQARHAGPNQIEVRP